MLNVVVDRQTWYRGNDSGSRLLRLDRQMCCLGFACVAAGLDDGEILGVNVIGSLPCVRQDVDGSVVAGGLVPEIFGLAVLDSVDAAESGKEGHKLYAINDSRDVDGTERESLLIEEGAKHGIAFSFIN